MTPHPDLKGVDARLLDFASAHHLVITSGRDGHHNVGSKHYRGLAIDFRSRGMSDQTFQDLEISAGGHGLLIRDERTRPPGQPVWGGPHGHLEVIE